MLEAQRPEEVMESNTNVEEWRLEVERVLPHLKVTVRNGEQARRYLPAFLLKDTR
jgi:estrogen-related receptor beta like 1